MSDVRSTKLFELRIEINDTICFLKAHISLLLEVPLEKMFSLSSLSTVMYAVRDGRYGASLVMRGTDIGRLESA